MARITETRHSSSLSFVSGHPEYTREEEHELALRWRHHGDTQARELLARAQLRHVVAIAGSYRRFGTATLGELIAEGNFGLVRALERFDPDRGTRFVTYAVYWIRAYISQYLLRNKSIVSSGVRSKVLAKVRRTRDQILQTNGEATDVNGQIAAQLALSAGDVRDLLQRLELRDVPWDHSTEDAPDSPTSGMNEPLWDNGEQIMVAAEGRARLSSAVSLVIATLDQRERYIVQRRIMAARGDELTLADIGRHFGVSRERARQLEARALQKIKTGLARSPLGAGCLSDRRAA